MGLRRANPLRRRGGAAARPPELRGVLVAVNGNGMDDAAVRTACGFARGTRIPLHLVHVIEMPWSAAVDAPPDDEVALRADAVLARASGIAASQGFPIEPELLQARAAGAAIVDEAVARDCDLTVLGLPFKHAHGHFTLGETVPYVLEHALGQVWVLRGGQDQPA